ncbi:hypothetical protein JYT51_01175 [Candidatus Amoebophilus asiaticus]|nr:hypothetical protein [Candidatus Amoebophilus asiaticus]
MKIITLIMLLFLGKGLIAQNTNTAAAERLKGKKLVVGLKEYEQDASEEEKELIDSSNAALKFAVENYWNFNKIEGIMPLSEAKKYAVTVGVYLPHYEKPMGEVYAVYAVMQLQTTLNLLYTKKIKSLLASGKYVRNNGPKVIKKTLLIPEDYLSPKLGKDDVKLAYPYDIDFASMDKVKRAILERDPKYAVVFWVPFPIAGDYLHRLYITNAEDGDIYGVADGYKVNLTFIPGKDPFDREYLINKKELKQIRKLVD